MPLIQKRKKLNDFLMAGGTTLYRRKPTPNSLTTRSIGTVYSNVGHHLGIHDDNDYIVVFHAQKMRPKFSQKKGRDGKTKSKQVRAGGWYARLFKIPKSMVKRVKQHDRHFDLELN